MQSLYYEDATILALMHCSSNQIVLTLTKVLLVVQEMGVGQKKLIYNYKYLYQISIFNILV